MCSWIRPWLVIIYQLAFHNISISEVTITWIRILYLIQMRLRTDRTEPNMNPKPTETN